MLIKASRLINMKKRRPCLIIKHCKFRCHSWHPPSNLQSDLKTSYLPPFCHQRQQILLILIRSANIIFISFNNIPAILGERAYEFKNLLLDYPGGSIVNTLPCNEAQRINPWSGNTPPAVEQLTLCAKITEPSSSND